MNDFTFRYKWITNKSLFDVHKEGFQTLTITKSGTYSFEVIGAGNIKFDFSRISGALIKGKIRLERGEKITVALGQQPGGNFKSGSGATFVVKEVGNRPLFVAAGAGYSNQDPFYAQGSLAQTANGNEKIGSSGIQKFQTGDEEDFYCAGAGFLKGPEIGRLDNKSEPPQSYWQGLMGGKGYDHRTNGGELEGGFGGGGAGFIRQLNEDWKWYYGCGGGYTGGSSRIWDAICCDGGGGGSFAADPNATFDHKFEIYGICKIEFLN